MRRGVDTPMHSVSSQSNLKVTTKYYEKKCFLVIRRTKKTFIKASCTKNMHIGEKSLCCCHFSRFVGGLFSNKVKKCVVYFALLESSLHFERTID